MGGRHGGPCMGPRVTDGLVALTFAQTHERWIEIGPPDYTCVQNTANFIVSAVSITALLIVLARMLRRRFRKQQGGSDRFG